MAENMESIYRRYNAKTPNSPDLELVPPELHQENGARVDCHDPGLHFKHMATDALNILEVFFTTCNHRKVAPVRWNWEYILFHSLGLIESRDTNLRIVAMLVCLVCSAAATDRGCIESTKNLYEAGYLTDLEKLMDPDLSNVARIEELIKPSGINEQKTATLQLVAELMVKNEGKCPSNIFDLMIMKGIGRKTAILQLNEAFGFFAGIGTDSHIVRIVLAFLWVKPEKNGPKPGAEHIEASLRTWIDVSEYKSTNRLFGSLGQMFTQQFSGKVMRNDDELRQVIAAMDEYINRPYHVELFWFMIRTVREYYRKNGSLE